MSGVDTRRMARDLFVWVGLAVVGWLLLAGLLWLLVFVPQSQSVFLAVLAVAWIVWCVRRAHT